MKVKVPTSRKIMGNKKTETPANYEQELKHTELNDVYCGLPGNSCADDSGCF